MSEESREIRVLRYMAWERAKGEMKSMLQTYYGNNDKFQEFKAEYEAFVKHVEDSGIHE